MKVPFIDLGAEYASIRDEIADAIHQVLNSSAFAGGPFVEQFEKEFASFCECKHGVAVGSGTEALWLTLLALGVGPGDEVITVPNTFIATAEAISFTGAKPVFLDIDEKTYNINPYLLEAAITARTKGIIPVHLYGHMADMDPVMEIARLHGLFVIEDSSQAHGAEYKGRLSGSLGDAGCFSFYPSKNLGAYGEAGAVVTNDTELARKIGILRDHGQPKKWFHTILGWNSRMDGLQGAVLSVKLKYLLKWNEARREKARIYTELFSDVDSVITPREASYAKHVYYIYAVRVQDRDTLMNYLTQKDIHCGIHYPIPIHLQDAYSFLGRGKGSFPVTEECADEFLSLPVFPELTREQIEHVVHETKQFLA